MPETTFHTTFSTSQFLLFRAKNGSERGLRSAVSYRFGFNGKENDNEVKGTGNQQDYGMRIYDPRLGRFLSADPLIVQGQMYPWYSPYQFAGNKPIQFIDLDGLEERARSVHSAKPLLKSPPAKFTTAQGGRFQAQCLNYGKGTTFARAYTGMTGNEQISAPTITPSASNGSEPVSEPSAAAQVANGVDASIKGGTTEPLEGHYDGAVAGKMDKQDVARGLGVMGVMTGVGGMIIGGSIVWGSISVAFSIDDISTNPQGETYIESNISNGYFKGAYNLTKAAISLKSTGSSLNLQAGADNSIQILGATQSSVSTTISTMNGSNQIQDAAIEDNQDTIIK